MIHHFLHYLTTHFAPTVSYLGGWFYALVLLIALLEATIVAGTFVPGTVILLFFGFMSSPTQGHISVIGVIVATVIGAVIGDFISYLIGRYGRGFIRENKGLLRMSHVEIGRAFFLKHGGKSVLLGRFVSPLRQIIPLIAGMVHMTYRRFTYLNVAGAILWATVYVLLGYYFGANSRLIDKVISRVGIVVTAIVIVACVYAFHRQRKKRFENLQKSDSSSSAGPARDRTVSTDVPVIEEIDVIVIEAAEGEVGSEKRDR